MRVMFGCKKVHLIMAKAVFYQSIGPELFRYDIDVDGATLTRRDAVTTPGANVQYVWPHP